MRLGLYAPHVQGEDDRSNSLLRRFLLQHARKNRCELVSPSIGKAAVTLQSDLLVCVSFDTDHQVKKGKRSRTVSLLVLG